MAPLCGLVLAMLLHAPWNLSTIAGINGFLAVYAFLQSRSSPGSSGSRCGRGTARVG